MAYAPIYEMHREKIIPFPLDVYQAKQALPLREEFYLSFIASAMLFPKDAECFAGYIACECNRILAQCESMLEVNFAQHGFSVMQMVTELFGSWANFSDHLRWPGFTKSGKGSLAERNVQGRVCGAVYTLQALSEKTLKDSIELALPMLDELRKYSDLAAVAPTLSFGNINNTIWPRFKDAGWLWAAFWHTNIEKEAQRIPLETLNMQNHIFNDIPLRGGWYGFLDVAMRFYQLSRDNEKRAGKNPPANGEIWQLSFQTESS